MLNLSFTKRRRFTSLVHVHHISPPFLRDSTRDGILTGFWRLCNDPKKRHFVDAGLTKYLGGSTGALKIWETNSSAGNNGIPWYTGIQWCQGHKPIAHLFYSIWFSVVLPGSTALQHQFGNWYDFARTEAPPPTKTTTTAAIQSNNNTVKKFTSEKKIDRRLHDLVEEILDETLERCRCLIVWIHVSISLDPSRTFTVNTVLSNSWATSAWLAMNGSPQATFQ